MIGTILILEDVRQSREWLVANVEKIFSAPRIFKEATVGWAERACTEYEFDLALVDLLKSGPEAVLENPLCLLLTCVPTTSPQIARAMGMPSALGLADSTVISYIKPVYRKLEISNPA